jgi:hypothetical protein
VRPLSEHQVRVELRADGSGTVTIDGADVSNRIGRVFVNASPGEGTDVQVSLPHAAHTLIETTRMTLAAEDALVLEACGWVSPEETRARHTSLCNALGHWETQGHPGYPTWDELIDRARRAAKKVDDDLVRRAMVQDALGGLGTVLREWDDLIRLVGELYARSYTGDDVVLSKVAEALGPYAPDEVKWSRVIEEVRELAARMRGLEK